MKKTNNRFVVALREGTSLKSDGLRQILVDKKTGVNYLVVTSGYGLGVTPLLDQDGKPIVSNVH